MARASQCISCRGWRVPTPKGAQGWRGLLESRKLDANAATEEDWLTLPFVGRRTAQSIVETRLQLGGVERFDQFLLVKGIGPKKLKMLPVWVAL